MVWSDKRVAELTGEFVTVADEVYMLYPEDRGNLERVKDRPEHQFFKKFGESMPEGDWNHPGTKQGIYMIGPDGEYLEGRFAASGFPEDVRERLERALERWQQLKKQKRYANKPVPKVVSAMPPEVADKPFVLRINSRDLPRAGDRTCGERFDPARHLGGGWQDFVEWAWNESWLAVEDPGVLVPSGKQEQAVDDAFVRQLVCTALTDNVRGQAGTWKQQAVRSAELTMQRSGKRDGREVIVYRGAAELVDGELSFCGKLYGEGLYDLKRRELIQFELIALGERTGGQQFNRRDQDPGPAPIGFAIARYLVPAEKAANSKARRSRR